MEMDLDVVNSLREAILETIAKWRRDGDTLSKSKANAKNAIIKLIKEGDANGFTRTNGARDFVENMGIDDFLHELCEYYKMLMME